MSAVLLSTARILSFDTETTGINLLDDRVVELGAAYFQGGKRLRTHRMLINPGRPIPAEASAVHGIYDTDVATAPGFAEVGARFALHLSGAALDGVAPVLTGYNAAAYDTPLMNAEFARYDLPTRIDAARVIDPFVFMKWHHRNLKGRKLTEACEHYGISLQNAHSAAADAQAAGELLYALVNAGLMPDDVEACLGEQRRFFEAIEREFRQWRNWLYSDRVTGALRIGTGKNVGRPVAEVGADWYAYILRQVDDLPQAVRAEFTKFV